MPSAMPGRAGSSTAWACRRGYFLAVLFWSLAAMAHALTRFIPPEAKLGDWAAPRPHTYATGLVIPMTVLGFSAARFALGLAEGGNFPAAVKTVSMWFPKKERALATGIFNAGSNVGALLAPLAGAVADHHVRLADRVPGHGGAGLRVAGRLVAVLPEPGKTSSPLPGGTGPHPQRPARSRREGSLADAAALPPDVGICRRDVPGLARSGGFISTGFRVS